MLAEHAAATEVRAVRDDEYAATQQSADEARSTYVSTRQQLVIGTAASLLAALTVVLLLVRDLEDEYTSLDKGWDLYFGNLRGFFARFAGQSVGNVVAMVFAAGRAADAWPVLLRALGLSGRPALGAEVVLDGPQKVVGVVDVATDEFLGVRSDTALFRFGAEGADGCAISAYHYLYGDAVDAAALTAEWQAWLLALFPTPDQG